MSARAGEEQARFLVMISGGGRTLENLVERIDAGDLPATISLVVASRECSGAERARRRGLETIIEPGVLSEQRLQRLADDAGAHWIVLAGYVHYVRIPTAYRHRVVNIHPALLPAFGGKGMFGRRVHHAVLEAGCKVSGCTVHLCDERYDAGPIIAQRCCPVLEDDTSDSLAERVFELEKQVYPEALRLLIGGKVSVEGGRARVEKQP